MDPNMQKYLAVLHTADLQSFSKAAEVMNYSQAAISRMIKDLENDWGIGIFERDSSGVSLTSDGIRLLPNIRALCQEYRNLGMHVDGLNGLQTGLIRIGSFASAAMYWLPNIIKKLKEDYPNIDYEIHVGSYESVEKEILDGRLDCAFLPLPTYHPLDTIYLESDYFLAVLPKGHPLATYDVVPIKALNEYPFFMIREKNDSEIGEIFEKYNVRPKTHLTSWNDYVAMAMVSEGLGLSIMSSTILQKCPFEIEIRKLDVYHERRIGFAVKNRKTASVAVKRFIDYLPYRHGAPAASETT